MADIIEKVIKGLECCVVKRNPQCSKCLYRSKKVTTDCVGMLEKDALKMLKEQRAEIERLRHEKDDAATVIQDLKEEIKELRMTARGQ